MKLRDLLKYQDIVIQCHDNPDADALASGYAVFKYLESRGKKPRLVYGGRNVIRKSNLVLMIKELEIPVEHVDRVDKPELLVTVDCQYEAGNVTRFDAWNVAVIDHHIQAGQLPENSIVREKLGSCSTLVWSMLIDEGYDLAADRKLSTALYYGLYTDTGSLSEISQPLDKELRDNVIFDDAIIARFKNCNMSLEELELAGTALLRSDYIEEHRFAIVKAGPCDPNVLGIISDLVLEVDAIDIVAVFCVLQNGVKLSVRSCVREVKASEMAEKICEGIGSGGGHLRKAGGFISVERLTPIYEDFCVDNNIQPRMVISDDGRYERPSDSAIKTIIEKRALDYFKNTTIIYGKDKILENLRMEEYTSRLASIGYIPALELANSGEIIKIRTIDENRDMDVLVDEDTILVVYGGWEIEEYSREAFEENFTSCPESGYESRDLREHVIVRVNSTGKSIDLSNHMKVCVPKSGHNVMAAEVENKVKLFANKDDTVYISGNKGDMIMSSEGKVNIISKEEFNNAFEKVTGKNPVKAVIFDLDGTLLDTLVDLKNAVNYALRTMGMPERTLDEVRRFVGNGVRLLMIRAVPDGEDNPEFEETFDVFKEYYGEHCTENTGAYQGIIPLLDELKTRGIKMAIVSNKIDFAVKELNDQYFSGYTSAAIGEMENVARKPAPDTALKAMRELGVTADECVYVGDSDVDIQTAKNAGIPCISVTWGFRDRDFLIKNGASCLIDKPEELLKYV